MTLRTHVDRYVALKRHLGFKFLNNERMLRSWAAWAMARGGDVIVVDTMIGWACDASSSDTARKRLSVARRFGHASIQSTEIYLRSDPIGKLDVLAARLPPAIRKGSFKEAPDRLLAILKDARAQ